LVLIALAACVPVRLEDDVTIGEHTALDRLVFGDYWEGHGDLAIGKDVAVAEFTVELVRERHFRSADRYGLKRHNTAYRPDVYEDIGHYLYTMFTELASERHGIKFRSLDQIAAASSYGQYSALDGKSVHRTYGEPIPTAAGFIVATDLVATPPLSVLHDEQDPTLIERDRALVAELGVDSVLRVRLRVGIHIGHATLEEGTVFSVTTATTAGNVESRRPLASNEAATETGFLRPSQGGDYVIGKTNFFHALGTIYPTYTRLIAESLGNE